MATRVARRKTSDIIKAIQTAVELKDELNIKVINMSLGGPASKNGETDPINMAIRAAKEAGVTVVVAAGNDGPDRKTVGSPGNSLHAITVGAIDDNNTNDRGRVGMASRRAKPGDPIPAGSEAAEAYENLIINGVSANLLFNLGNARFKAGEYGHAMAAYHRALKLAPRHPDIAANLRIVHQKALTEPIPTSLRQQWLRNLSLGEWTAITSFCVTLFLILLTLKQIRKGSENALWNQLTGGASVVSALLLTMAAADYFGNEQAFAVRDGVIVHTGPLEQSPELF